MVNKSQYRLKTATEDFEDLTLESIPTTIEDLTSKSTPTTITHKQDIHHKYGKSNMDSQSPP